MYAWILYDNVYMEYSLCMCATAPYFLSTVEMSLCVAACDTVLVFPLSLCVFRASCSVCVCVSFVYGSSDDDNSHVLGKGKGEPPIRRLRACIMHIR